MAKKFFTKKKKEEKASTSGFWVPVSIVVAGALVAGAVLAGGRLNLGGSSKRVGEKPLGTEVAESPKAPTEGAKKAVTEERLDLFVGDSPMLGEATASVTLVEFTDFQCPACRAFLNQFFPQIKAEYIDQGLVNYVIKHFPLSFHKNAAAAAGAAECARAQGEFWRYHDLLFEEQPEWAGEADPTTLFSGYAGRLNLKMDQFGACLDTEESKARVADDLELGKKIGVSGTPTIFVNGLRAGRPGFIPSFLEIKKLIEKELR